MLHVMKKDLRGRLTFEFVMLFVLLYFLGGAVAIFMFAVQLDKSIDNELSRLTSQVLPAIDILPSGPSLKRYVGRAIARHEEMVSSVQVFSSDGKLIEELGPPGHRSLVQGQTSLDKADNFATAGDVNLRSHYTEIRDNARAVGYVQVQVSTSQRDDALKQIILTMISLSPFLALAVGICGSLFAGNAVKPVEDTMELLRQFVADAAHEINTPIAVIEASVQTLEDVFAESQIGSNVLAIISRASGRMKALGQSLIVLSRLESAEYQTPLIPLSLEGVICPVVAECEQLARLKHIDLVLGPVPALQVLGDAVSLERMLLNLIANAVRYTDDGGKVEVDCLVLPDAVKIQVKDSGIGIPEESLPHVFQRFYRVDKSRSRELGGFGLGLAIVKAIVDRHRGEIEVSSALGKGTCFTVSLKRAV